VFLEERDAAAQDGFVEVVAEIGDHPESGVVHKVGAAIIAEPLDESRDHEGDCDDDPVIVKMGGHEVAQVELIMGAGDDEKRDSALRGVRVEDAIEDGFDEQQPEGFEQTDSGHEDDGKEGLQRVGPEIAEQAEVSRHCRSPFAIRVGAPRVALV
jgi:hypothetical protein